MTDDRYSVDDLLRVMERLRDPHTGCPWDREQDFHTIVSSTLEESYELVAAIEAGDWPHVADELGDLLFQVVFYTQLGRERELFDFPGIVHGLTEKLLRRHPHVFADGDIEAVVHKDTDSAAVKQRWEQIKAGERAARDQHGALDDVPMALPALPRAQKLQKRAARVGFDWEQADAVLEKLQEEIGELREAMAVDDALSMEDELGDLLFTTVSLGRHLRLDAETALRRASTKFERRFRAMEQRLASQQRLLAECDPSELESLWEAAKQQERG